jgi:hypothetical protein
MKEFDTTGAEQDEKKITLRDIINGGFFSKNSLSNHWPFLVFAVFLTMIYISNHYAVEKLLKEQVALNYELKELKYEAITTSSELMQMSRQSEVLTKVEQAGLGLEVLKTPPRILKVEK